MMVPDRLRTDVALRLGWRAVMVLLIGTPMAWAAGYALAYSLGGVGRLSQGWTLSHWQAIASQSQLFGTLIYSLTISFLVTASITGVSLTLLLSVPSLRGHRAFLTCSIMLMGTPGLVLAQMVGQFLGPGGWMSRILWHAGAIDSAGDFPPLVNDRLSIGMILAIVLTLWPLVMLYLAQVWDSARLDRRCELAQSLGASVLDARWRVALPVLFLRSRSIIVLVFILALGSFEIPLVLGRQSPQMFSVATQKAATGFDLMLKPQAYVLASLYLICTSLLLAVYLRMRAKHE